MTTRDVILNDAELIDIRNSHFQWLGNIDYDRHTEPFILDGKYGYGESNAYAEPEKVGK